MGFFKNMMIEDQERGWSLQGEFYVCCDCFRDNAIKEFILERLSHNRCDYCGNYSESEYISTPIDSVIDLINTSISVEWGDPNEELPYESREGGYQGKVYDIDDLLFGEIEDIFNNENVRRAVIDSFMSHGRQWCKINYFALRPEEVLKYGWDEFSLLVMHHTRYLFSIAPDDRKEHRGYEEIPPGKFLARLGRIVNEIGLVRIFPQEIPIFRARVHKATDKCELPANLGPPLADQAVNSNRMSPAGIPMFYGALDEKTAIDETVVWNKKNELVTVGKFITARELRILDLYDFPELPSLFDSNNRHNRPGIMFLKSFLKDISKPINKEDEKNYRYVPTQIVTEYFRKMFIHNDGSKVDGILYKSSINENGKCCVLFFGNEHCCAVTPGWDKEIVDELSQSYKWWLGLESYTRYKL